MVSSSYIYLATTLVRFKQIAGRQKRPVQIGLRCNFQVSSLVKYQHISMSGFVVK